MCFCLRRDTTMHWATIGGESKSSYSGVGLPMQSVVSQWHLTRCIPSIKYSMNWINTESQTHILKMPRLCLPKTRHFWTILVQFGIRSTFCRNCCTTEVSQMSRAYCICVYWGKDHNWFYLWSSPITLYGLCGSMTVFIRHIWVSDLCSEGSPMRHTPQPLHRCPVNSLPFEWMGTTLHLQIVYRATTLPHPPGPAYQLAVLRYMEVLGCCVCARRRGIMWHRMLYLVTGVSAGL